MWQRRYQELTDAMQALMAEGKMDEAQELGEQLQAMTGKSLARPRAMGGGKRNKKSKKRKSKRKKSKKRKSRTRRRSR